MKALTASRRVHAQNYTREYERSFPESPRLAFPPMKTFQQARRLIIGSISRRPDEIARGQLSVLFCVRSSCYFRAETEMSASRVFALNMSNHSIRSLSHIMIDIFLSGHTHTHTHAIIQIAGGFLDGTELHAKLSDSCRKTPQFPAATSCIGRHDEHRRCRRIN